MAFRSISVFCVLAIFVGSAFAQMMRPSLTIMKRNGVFPLRTKPTKEQKKRLQPHPQDLTKYGQFLETPRTGIFRLLPDLGCYENINILKADEICLNAIPESSYYSFREREHTLEILSDIRLKSGNFISDGILAQGILVNLGDVELEKITPESEGLEFLGSFAPNSSALEAKDQYMQFVRGVKAGKHEYKKIVPALENSSYALRVVAYRGNVIRSYRGFRFDLLDGDKRIDLTIAFRVIRKDADGTVTLLWKELERRAAPRIKFPKKKNNKVTA